MTEHELLFIMYENSLRAMELRKLRMQRDIQRQVDDLFTLSDEIDVLKNKLAEIRDCYLMRCV